MEEDGRRRRRRGMGGGGVGWEEAGAEAEVE